MKEKLTRREFLSGGGKPEKGIERKGNVTTIYKPEGVYSVIYGMHVLSQKTEEVPEDTNLVMLENPVWVENPLGYLHGAMQHPQYEKLFSVLEEKRIPVLFADHDYEHKFFGYPAAAMGLDMGIMGAQACFGSNLICGSSSSKTFPRRMAMKGIGGWLTLPFLSNVPAFASVPLERTSGPVSELIKVSHKTHPEFFLLLVKTRNSVITFKQEALMHRLGNKPHIATVIGGAHAEIEDSIQTSWKDKLAYLQRIAPLLKAFGPGEEFYKMAQMEFNGKEWEQTEMYVFPELKALIS